MVELDHTYYVFQVSRRIKLNLGLKDFESSVYRLVSKSPNIGDEIFSDGDQRKLYGTRGQKYGGNGSSLGP